MENASKALMIAAGVLIGVLILSLGVYLITTFGQYSAKIQAQNEQNRLNEFNSQFTIYEGREDLTIYDVITVANYAKENNEKYNITEGDESTFYINVKCDNQDFENLTIKQQNEKLSTYQESIIDSESKTRPTYTCKSVKISKITGRVYQIVFLKNN